MRAAKIVSVLLTIAFGVTVGCADIQRGEPATPGDGDTDGVSGGDNVDGLSFADAVHPLLLSGCESCHGTGQSASNSGFVLTGEAESDFHVAAEFVDTEQPASSRLLTKASGVAHGGGTVFSSSSSEYETLLTWIREGAFP